jgi:hypothetical protein
MSNINITSTKIEFTSTASGWLLLTEPRWEVVDETSLHVITEHGVYLISINEHKINGKTYTSSSDTIAYLNNL